MLLHAKCHWLDKITNMMWPFTVKTAYVGLNKFSQNKDEFSPDELLNNMRVNVNLVDCHTFGCPVFVLNRHL